MKIIYLSPNRQRTDVYMQDIPVGVEAVIEAVNTEVRLKPELGAAG